MKQAVLDTSFILTCVKQKIDFLNEIKFMGLEILIPASVIKEIKSLSEGRSGGKFKAEENSKIALKLLEENCNSFKKIFLPGRNTDKSIIKFAGESKDVVIATLDREMKEKIKNPKLIIRGRKKLEII